MPTGIPQIISELVRVFAGFGAPRKPETGMQINPVLTRRFKRNARRRAAKCVGTPDRYVRPKVLSAFARRPDNSGKSGGK
jgi:hypothetical protein